MSRFEKRILWALGLLILGLSLLEAMAPKPINWAPSYSRYHRTPYGGLLVHESIQDLFPEVRTVHEPVDLAADHRISNDAIADAPVNHLYINSTFGLSELGTERLLGLVELGDHVFIAAEDFHNVLADTLNLEVASMHRMGNDTSDIRFVGDHRIAQGVFRYARGFPGAYFTRYDTSRTRVLAVDGASHPVLLEMTWGDGRIVLCSAPRAFTNYNLLKSNNAAFLAGALSALPFQPVVWDEFYKVGRMESTTPLRFLLNQPALRWAWFIALTLLVLYIIVYTRRQQRPIPFVAPPRNATRDLAHTIGRLYWHKGDHADIARKMIAHFKDEVRARAYMRTFDYDENTVAHLATKTGRAKEEIAKRLNAFRRREQLQSVTERDLLDLSTELHEFRQLIR